MNDNEDETPHPNANDVPPAYSSSGLTSDEKRSGLDDAVMKTIEESIDGYSAELRGISLDIHGRYLVIIKHALG